MQINYKRNLVVFDIFFSLNGISASNGDTFMYNAIFMFKSCFLDNSTTKMEIYFEL